PVTHSAWGWPCCSCSSQQHALVALTGHVTPAPQSRVSPGLPAPEPSPPVLFPAPDAVVVVTGAPPTPVVEVTATEDDAPLADDSDESLSSQEVALSSGLPSMNRLYHDTQ